MRKHSRDLDDIRKRLGALAAEAKKLEKKIKKTVKYDKKKDPENQCHERSENRKSATDGEFMFDETSNPTLPRKLLRSLATKIIELLGIIIFLYNDYPQEGHASKLKIENE